MAVLFLIRNDMVAKQATLSGEAISLDILGGLKAPLSTLLLTHAIGHESFSGEPRHCI